VAGLWQYLYALAAAAVALGRFRYSARSDCHIREDDSGDHEGDDNGSDDDIEDHDVTRDPDLFLEMRSSRKYSQLQRDEDRNLQ
jgi:hypothetical protein